MFKISLYASQTESQQFMSGYAPNLFKLSYPAMCMGKILFHLHLVKKNIFYLC